MIVFDGSGSMAEMGFNQLNEPRIFEARKAVRSAMPQVAPYRRLGLIIYGPGPLDSCDNIDLRFGPINNAAGPIIDAVDGLMPDGDTPLTQAVALAAQTLDYENAPATVVLVTDGKETCGGSPCELAAILAADGYDTTVHVIGFKVRGDSFVWESEEQDDLFKGRTVARCLAERTGGQYVSTETVDELIAALNETLGCSLIGSRAANFG